MKAFTDLEQSKKLAEILPSESADMVLWGKDFKSVCADIHAQEFMKGLEYRKMNYVPCWSLAALLGVLPKNLNIGRPSLESNYRGYYWIQYYDEFMKTNDYKTECYDNPTDACVAMIENLHELKML